MSSSVVTLRVYDLSRGLARQVSPALLGKQIDGIWHTGVLVFGREFFFGGGGIQALAPEVVVARYGMEPVRQLVLGDTAKTASQLEAFLRANAHRFTDATYDLLRHNCNNFSDEVATFLLGHGIPREILDLPNEALSTPLGAMLRPMLENMQREMGGAHAFGNPFNDPTRTFADASPAAAFADAPSAPCGGALFPRKFVVSGAPTLRLDAVVRRVAALHRQPALQCLSAAQLAALRELETAMHDHRVDFTPATSAATSLGDASILQWWTIVLALLQHAGGSASSPFLFPALALFRVVLLLPTRSVDVLELKDQCFDALLRATEGSGETLTRAQTVLALAVLVNGFANPAATELVQARALRFLPFVFRVLSEGDADADVRVLSATLIRNCCLAMKIEEEMVITTIVCGCAEVMDRLLREAATAPRTLEGLVVGLGLLLQNFEAARSLSVELGLGDVLRRLQSAPALRTMQPLLSEVVALI